MGGHKLTDEWGCCDPWDEVPWRMKKGWSLAGGRGGNARVGIHLWERGALSVSGS